jgi:hypothetical protein
MPRDTLEERYLTWLLDLVSDPAARIKSRTHRRLLRQMHNTIFVAIVPHDENRIADGIDLRYEFLANCEDVQGDPNWTRSPCTMLELLVVLSRQLAFEMDESPVIWFWHLIEVLGLKHFNDREYDGHAAEEIEEILNRVIWRTYSSNGSGGLFPLRNPPRDQRKVELWYQLNAYLLENF